MRPGRLPLAILSALALAACGGDEQSSSSRQASTPSPRLLLVQLSDLPAGFEPVPGETIPTPLAVILADPWSRGHEAVIRRERVSGYQTAFWTPERRRVDCGVAVYRSGDAAARVFRIHAAGFEGFLRASSLGHTVQVGELGEETRAQRYEIEGLQGFGVMWRDRNILSVCGSLGPRPPDPEQVARVAQLQESRISRALSRGA